MSVEQSVSTAAAIGLAARGNMIRNLSNTSSPMTMRDLEKSQQIRLREPALAAGREPRKFNDFPRGQNSTSIHAVWLIRATFGGICFLAKN